MNMYTTFFDFKHANVSFIGRKFKSGGFNSIGECRKYIEKLRIKIVPFQVTNSPNKTGILIVSDNGCKDGVIIRKCHDNNIPMMTIETYINTYNDLKTKYDEKVSVLKITMNNVTNNINIAADKNNILDAIDVLINKARTIIPDEVGFTVNVNFSDGLPVSKSPVGDFNMRLTSDIIKLKSEILKMISENFTYFNHLTGIKLENDKYGMGLTFPDNTWKNGKIECSIGFSFDKEIEDRINSNYEAVSKYYENDKYTGD